MKFVFLIPILFLFFCGQSQIDTLKDIKLAVKLAPLATIDLVTKTSYRGGVEFKVSRNKSIYIEGGGFFPNYNASNVKGFLIKIEPKVYFSYFGRCNGEFISVEYMFMKQSYDYTDSIKLNGGYLKDYRINKTINCINLKFGKTIVFKRNFLIEWSFGLGARFKIANSTLTNEEADNRYYGGDPAASMINQFNNKIGHRTALNISGGLKVGYRLF